MKHYVLGLIFDSMKDKILLINKKRPTWMAGHWNGIGGKVEKDETPLHAMGREVKEETGYGYPFEHVITFVCPGGTVFVFKSIATDTICFQQIEDEELRVWSLHNLPSNRMANLRWIIPLSLSSVQFPVIIQQNELGVHL